jgi:hypothetical protein
VVFCNKTAVQAIHEIFGAFSNFIAPQMLTTHFFAACANFNIQGEKPVDFVGWTNYRRAEG